MRQTSQFSNNSKWVINLVTNNKSIESPSAEYQVEDDSQNQRRAKTTEPGLRSGRNKVYLHQTDIISPPIERYEQPNMSVKTYLESEVKNSVASNSFGNSLARTNNFLNPYTFTSSFYDYKGAYDYDFAFKDTRTIKVKQNQRPEFNTQLLRKNSSANEIPDQFWKFPRDKKKIVRQIYNRSNPCGAASPPKFLSKRSRTRQDAERVRH